jgi:transcriptional regulator with XRE-family HTH domain
MEATSLGAVLMVRVRQEREKRGWSQRKLSERSGVPQPTISRIEAGVRKLDLVALEKIAKAFGVPPLRLLRHVTD